MMHSGLTWSVCLLVAAQAAPAQEAAPAPSLAGQLVLMSRADVPLFVAKDGKWQEVGQVSRPIAWVKQATEGAYHVQAGEQDGWVRKAEAVLLDEAAAYFTDRIARDPKDAFAHRQRALARSEQRYTDYDGAQADLDEAIRLQPGDPVHWRHRGLNYAFKGQYDRALPDLDESIRLDPTAADAYNKRSQVWGRKRDYDKALGDSEEAIRREPRNGDHYCQRANAWFAKGDRVRAWADLDKAVELQPDMGWFHMARATWHQQFGELTQALAELDKVVALEPSCARGYRDRSYLHMLRVDYPAALADIDRALKLDPTYELYHLRKMQIFIRRGSYEEAEAVATEAIRVCPKNREDLYGNRATLKILKKDYAGALADYDGALRDAPKSVHYQAMRAEVLATCPDKSLRDLDRAIAEAARLAEQVGGKDAETLQRVAFYCTLAGRAEDAERWRVRAQGLKPSSSAADPLPPLPPGKP